MRLRRFEFFFKGFMSHDPGTNSIMMPDYCFFLTLLDSVHSFSASTYVMSGINLWKERALVRSTTMSTQIKLGH